MDRLVVHRFAAILVAGLSLVALACGQGEVATERLAAAAEQPVTPTRKARVPLPGNRPRQQVAAEIVEEFTSRANFSLEKQGVQVAGRGPVTVRCLELPDGRAWSVYWKHKARSEYAIKEDLPPSESFINIWLWEPNGESWQRWRSAVDGKSHTFDAKIAAMMDRHPPERNWPVVLTVPATP